MSSFISWYSLNTLFTKKKLCWLKYESIKIFEIRTLIVCNLSFSNNTVLSCISFFFLKINMYFLIPALIFQIFIPTAELLIPTRPQPNEANAEIVTQLVSVEAKIYFRYLLVFFLRLWNRYVFFLLKDSLFFHLF